MNRTPKPCPGCGDERRFSREMVVPSDRRLGEPEGVGIRYLFLGVRGMFRPVHKCPVPVQRAAVSDDEFGVLVGGNGPDVSPRGVVDQPADKETP